MVEFRKKTIILGIWKENIRYNAWYRKQDAELQAAVPKPISNQGIIETLHQEIRQLELIPELKIE
jgi:hypothetical protein